MKYHSNSFLTKRIIPCLDIKNGKVVKGIHFINIKNAGDPIEIAQRYNDQGADELILLDITANQRNNLIFSIIEKIAYKVFIPLTVGGGIRKLEDVQRLLNYGADRICINSFAVYNPKLIRSISNYHGSQCVVVAIDVKRDHTEIPTWKVFTHGGSKKTGLDVLKWAKFVSCSGAGELLLTSMDRDGTKNGFDLELIRKISDSVSIPVIASGGVGTWIHLLDGITIGHASAVLAASIFHFDKVTLLECKNNISQQGISVRYVS